MASRWTSRPVLRLPKALLRTHTPGRYMQTQPILSRRPSTFYPKLSSHPQYHLRLFSSSPRNNDSKVVVRVPPMAESITEGTLSQFSKSIGDFIEVDEELATIETDKIDVSVNATQSGIIQQLLVAEGDVVTVDQVIAEIQPGQKQPESEPESENAQSASKQSNLQHNSTQATQSSTPPPAAETMPTEFSKPEREASKDTTSPKKDVAPAQSTEAPNAFQGMIPSRAEEKASAYHSLRDEVY
ncbi:hypothetical protein MYU51_007189 [Penicillium brevicompactum]